MNARGMRFSLAAILVLAAIVIACTSHVAMLQERARDHLRLSSWDDAVAAYEDLAREFPDQASYAADGIRRAREGWVAESLNRVRAARREARWDDVLSGMADVVRWKRDWNLELSGALAEFNAQETDAVAIHAEERSSLLAGRKQYLAARAFLDTHRDAFGDGSGARAWHELGAALAAEGGRHCETLWRVASIRTPWFADAAARYCAAWGVDKVVPEALLDLRRKESFSTIKARTQVRGLESDEVKSLEALLQRVLEGSPGYEPDGTATLVVDAKGAYVHAETRRPETREHPYVMRVPYSDLEEYCEWTQVPVRTYKTAPDGSRQEMVEYRSECDPSTRPIQRIREVPQQLTYPVKVIRVVHRLQLSLEGRLGGRPFRILVEDAFDKEEATHETSRPDIGLAEAPPTLAPRGEWLQARFGGAAADFGDRLRESWTEKFCVPLDNPSVDLAAEQVFRCLAVGEGSVPGFVGDWLRAWFGMEPEEVREILGIGKARSLGAAN